VNKLPSVSSEKIIKRLLKVGFDYAPIKGKGSHSALVKVGSFGEKYLVIIPKREPVPKPIKLGAIL
jgi:predicted RNA binding protein YcfA (HicA-like mRNA interferase family)